MGLIVLRTRGGITVRALACGFALAFTFNFHAPATQHLIRPGEEWQKLDSRLRPGDEIILMPGNHRPAAFGTLAGTAERPVIIRGLDPANPPTIAAERYGLRFAAASHVILKDFSITGASVAAIALGQTDPASPAPNAASVGAEPIKAAANDQRAAATRSGPVLLRNISLTRTGPRGQRHALTIANSSSIQIELCTVEGWGGAGVQIISCTDVRIEQCIFKGLDDHTQLRGIEVGGGSERIAIVNCRFTDAGDRVVCLGVKRVASTPPAVKRAGSQGPAAASPALAGAPPSPQDKSAAAASLNAPQFEAAQVQVEHCTIIRGGCSIALLNADDCTIRNNTIVRPRRSVVGFWNDRPNESRFSAARRNIFGFNLITWDAGDLQRLAEIGPLADPVDFTLEPNLWWSVDFETQRKWLGPLPGKDASPQVMELDPKLDSNFKPAEPAAAAFGAQ